MLDLKRRQFIALVGGGGLLLAAKVGRARGRQPAMPVVGLCHQSIAIMGCRLASYLRMTPCLF
jgi:hypothetical protein